jgi:hypothetical protein
LDQAAYVSFLQCFFSEAPELYKQLHAVANQSGFSRKNSLHGRDDSSDEDDTLDGDNSRGEGIQGSSTYGERRSISLGSVDSESYGRSSTGTNRSKLQRTNGIGIPEEVLQSLRNDVQSFLRNILSKVGPTMYENLLDQFVELRSFYRLGNPHYYSQRLASIRRLLSTGTDDPSLLSHFETLFPTSYDGGSIRGTNNSDDTGSFEHHLLTGSDVGYRQHISAVQSSSTVSLATTDTIVSTGATTALSTISASSSASIFASENRANDGSMSPSCSVDGRSFRAASSSRDDEISYKCAALNPTTASGYEDVEDTDLSVSPVIHQSLKRGVANTKPTALPRTLSTNNFMELPASDALPRVPWWVRQRAFTSNEAVQINATVKSGMYSGEPASNTNSEASGALSDDDSLNPDFPKSAHRPGRPAAAPSHTSMQRQLHVQYPRTLQEITESHRRGRDDSFGGLNSVEIPADEVNKLWNELSVPGLPNHSEEVEDDISKFDEDTK